MTLSEFDGSFLSSTIRSIAGIDEAGRGPLAGPVVASAVVFNPGTFIPRVNDSKQLSSKIREELYHLIVEQALTYGIGIIHQEEIDKINILQATLKAMEKSLNELSINPDLVLIDGNRSFKTKTKTTCIVKGDTKSFLIASASILAKVTRDSFMKKAHLKYPQYNWEQNKGYGTREHIDAIKKHGITPLHRKSFLRKILPDTILDY